jgi:hypothetical protein
MIDREEHRRFRAYVRALRANCPPDRPVEVRRFHIKSKVKGSELDGYVEFSRDNSRYLLRLHTALGYPLLIETLTHEWAHCLRGETDDGEHDDRWGVCYARAFRAVDRMKGVLLS